VESGVVNLDIPEYADKIRDVTWTEVFPSSRLTLIQVSNFILKLLSYSTVLAD
jgi:hypothetical protein